MLWEKGEVKWYNIQKRFGFIVTEGGEEIFFHLNDGDRFKVGPDNELYMVGRLEREPRKGDRVVFMRSRNKKGPIACPWGFADDYERAEKEIAAHPAPVTYRVLKQTTVYGNPPYKPEVFWEGNDTTKLCQRFPRSDDRRIDDLWPTFSCDDFEYIIWFERKTDSGWERCEDPRPMQYGRRQR